MWQGHECLVCSWPSPRTQVQLLLHTDAQGTYAKQRTSTEAHLCGAMTATGRRTPQVHLTEELNYILGQP